MSPPIITDATHRCQPELKQRTDHTNASADPLRQRLVRVAHLCSGSRAAVAFSPRLLRFVFLFGFSPTSRWGSADCAAGADEIDARDVSSELERSSFGLHAGEAHVEVLPDKGEGATGLNELLSSRSRKGSSSTVKPGACGAQAVDAAACERIASASGSAASSQRGPRDEGRSTSPESRKPESRESDTTAGMER
jgi:hypothetical protein